MLRSGTKNVLLKKVFRKISRDSSSFEYTNGISSKEDMEQIEEEKNTQTKLTEF